MVTKLPISLFRFAGLVGLLAVTLFRPVYAATVTAHLDRAQVAVGESVVLSVEVGGTQDAAAPDLSGLADFRSRYLGPSTQMRFENGRTSSSITHRYQLFPEKPGRFPIGPFDVKIGATTLRTQPLALVVLPRGAAAAAGRPELRLEVRVGRTDPFVGEQAPLTVRLLVPHGVRVDDLQFPVVEGEALSVGAMPQPVQRDERVNGVAYRVLTFDTYLIPRKAVAMELVATMEMSVLERQRQRRRGVFGMFGDAFAERRPVELRSDPLRLIARGLPAAGRPPGFAGAVGTFDLNVSASPLSVAAGDPITVRIEVSGDGDLSRVPPPRFANVEGFRVYDPTSVKEPGPGKRAIEQVLIPQSPAVSELPTLSLSFFDPTRESYRTIHQQPIPLVVRAAEGAPSGVIAQGSSGRAERAAGPIGRDIVSIKSLPGRWVPSGSRWLASVSFWIASLLPAVAVAGLWWRSRRESRLAANPALRRFRSAESDARAALSGLVSGDPRLYCDELATLLREFLSAKLGLPPGAVEGGAVARAMTAAGYDDDLAAATSTLLSEMEGIRYSGVSTADPADLRARVERVIAGVESRKDVTEKLAKSILALLFAISCGLGSIHPSPAGADVASDSENESAFFAGNHAYADERYRDAIEQYEKALALGSESGPLHYNLGNAYFKDGATAEALASYMRAGRLIPRDPDVAVNLSFARESLELGEDRDPLWQRIVFPLAYRAAERELALAWLALWWAVCGGLAAIVLRPELREPLRWPIRLTAAAAAVTLVSLIFRSNALELTHAAVVTQANGVAVRFEPSPDGTEHFQAPSGARLRVDEQRGDWSRVSRRDGRRGWVPSSTIARLR